MRDETETITFHKVYLKRVRGTVVSTTMIEVPAVSYAVAMFKALVDMPGWEVISS